VAYLYNWTTPPPPLARAVERSFAGRDCAQTQAVQSSTIFPQSSRRMISKPSRNWPAGMQWVLSLRTSRPLSSIAIILWPVSNISRP
jgi:hypothetical protein